MVSNNKRWDDVSWNPEKGSSDIPNDVVTDIMGFLTYLSEDRFKDGPSFLYKFVIRPVFKDNDGFQCFFESKTTVFSIRCYGDKSDRIYINCYS